ncbi:MAG: hypothetical protein RMN25_09645, partial [Anaerolineae bacterium]|nr:hypothetical protein [Thermoflexales bacterium]MDW8408033.1 hypothetical protein [Anaerolineae bacterium]
EGLVKTKPLQGCGYYWLGHGFSPPQPPSSSDEYEALRIAAGYPAYPAEINEQYIPLEAGLWDAISFDKGCYIGQEIIARMESRGRLAKRLVRLRWAGHDDMPPQAGDRLLHDGQEVGVLTSVSPTGRFALGYVQTAYAQEGMQLGVARPPAQLTAQIVGLTPLELPEECPVQ